MFDHRLLFALSLSMVASLACGDKHSPLFASDAASAFDPDSAVPDACSNGACTDDAGSNACDPECGPAERCEAAMCVPDPIECESACEPGQRCEGGLCIENVCRPGCGDDEYCETDGTDSCRCRTPPCLPTMPAGPCEDSVDNDGDGWVDAFDPDCRGGVDEAGFGASGCNDSIDDDGDGTIDASDPQCTTALDDEVSGPLPCTDICLLGAEDQARTCTLWSSSAKSWVPVIDDGPGQLHNRARVYTRFLRERLMPVGGVFRTQFTDATYSTALRYHGARDSPIWTGAYLASEALRYMVSGAPDAHAQMEETIRTIHRWWTVSGDPGYLARYAAPANSAPAVLSLLDASDEENHRDVPFEGSTWHWKGNISRDQYQGVILGYSLAYDATQDLALRETIRSDIVGFIEQLMRIERRPVNLSINGLRIPVQMDLQHVVYTDDETPDGNPALEVTISPFDAVDVGFLLFWPNPSEYLRQVPGFGWLPDIPLRGQTIQLASMFTVALHVTEGVAAYAARRQAILQHYESHVDEWLESATGWNNTNQCGGSYHGLNIAFMPAYNWARLETDPVRKSRIQREVLRDAMWGDVFDHKNVFFAYLYASQAHPSDDVAPIVTAHTEQLRQFPVAPNLAVPVDNRGRYAEDSDCEDLSSVAVDVGDRVPSVFMWERNPWKLFDPGIPNYVHPGVDYLIAYWMARRYGYLPDDSPGACLQWR